jgi:predicted CoA-binding protein
MSTQRQQPEVIAAALGASTIAIVGLSSNPMRPSYGVAEYLINAGFEVIPVNPREQEVLGLHCYASLAEVPVAIDMVDVFRESSAVPDIAQLAVAIGAKFLWLQLGVISDEGVGIAEAGGMQCVVDLCTKIEHQRLS